MNYAATTLAMSLLLPQAVTTEVNEQSYHTVEKGETLYQISKDNDISLWEISVMNPQIEDLDKIKIGDQIKVKSEYELDRSFFDEDILKAVDEKINSSIERHLNRMKNLRIQSNNIVQKEIDIPGDNSYYEMTVEATAYTAYCAGCSGTTATGIDLRANPNQKVIAVDPNVIPLGSKVWVEGYGYAIAGDTGGAIKGNKIDIFVPNIDDAYKWGRQHIKIRVYK